MKSIMKLKKRNDLFIQALKKNKKHDKSLGMIIGYLSCSLSFHLYFVVIVLFFVLFGARDYRRTIFSESSPWVTQQDPN